MSKLPNGWADVMLAELASHRSGNSKLIKGKLSSEPTASFPYKGYSASGQDVWLDTYEYEGDAIIISAVGARCGKAFSASGTWSAVANTHIVWPKPQIINHRLFWYLINDERFWVRGGSAQPFVKVPKTFERMFKLPPLKEQERITDKLDAVRARVDACRDRLDRIPAILKRFRQSVLAAATSGKLTADWRELNHQPVGQASNEVLQRLILRREMIPDNKKFKEPSACDLTYWNIDIPSTWSVESVSAYAECLDHLRIPVTRNKRANTQGLYPYYGANGQVDMVDEYLFDDELVLVTEDETFYGREKPIAYRTSGRCWVNNHAHVLRAGDRFRADYLCFALMYYNVLPWLTGTTGRAKLTQGVLNSLPIAVPPQTELLEIVRRVESLFSYADRLETRYTAARTRVEKLTPATHAKAFRGELVPQDTNDEPASVLLERLKAKRSEQVLTKPKRNSKVTA